LDRAKAIKLVLEDLGIDPSRFAIEWVSGAEAPKFQKVVTEFTEKIKSLGPNPVRLEKHKAVSA